MQKKKKKRLEVNKALMSIDAQILRNWFQIVDAKCFIDHHPQINFTVLSWIDDSSLVFAADALLDEDGALVSVPVKRGGDGGEEPAGMWFGPRLGKRNKRSIDVPWTVFTVRGTFIFFPPYKFSDFSAS
jgi:hypothetical protein